MNYNRDRFLDKLNKLYPVPRQWIKQNSRDKHDFNDLYIRAVSKRIKYLRHHTRPPKKIAVINWKSGFWVDSYSAGIPRHRLRTRVL